MSTNLPAKYGWAPGYYFCKCSICNNEFTGDKRASQCQTCAYSKEAAIRERNLLIRNKGFLTAALEDTKSRLSDMDDRIAAIDVVIKEFSTKEKQ
jgi:hypothetical protein